MFDFTGMPGTGSSSYGQNIGTGPFGFLFQPELLANIAVKACTIHLGLIAFLAMAALWASHRERLSRTRITRLLSVG